MAANQNNDELLDRARAVIRELREKLAQAEAKGRPAPIAVIGMACDLPGARTDMDAFWKMLVEGREAIGAIPSDRWDRDAFYAPQAPVPGKMNTRHSGFLGDVGRFDAAFFDVAPVEAIAMDPQQRVFLETAWQALEDAGLTKANLSGSDTGVFVGVHSQSSDYCGLQLRDVDSIGAYTATGTALDVIAGRLCYWLNLQGPSLAVNSACSSSLAAVHLACRSLRAGDCSAAVVGGVNMILSPAMAVAAAQMQMLSPDGRCKTFDSRADGIGRAEGCGVVVLKRLSDATRDGDRILAVIRGSAMNQDGRTNGLTAPNSFAQQRLLRKALEDAGVRAEQVGYIETHGTGTSLGDPIEVEALAEVFGDKTRSSPCTLGAVKANIGHLEGAAGIAGLIKAVLVLQHAFIPPVANLKELNPHLPLSGSKLSIPRQGAAWESEGRRFAGVSGFGFSGTNAHIVLEEAPAPEAARCGNGPVLIAVSAESIAALKPLALAFADRLERAQPEELENSAFTSAVRRTHFRYRIAVIGEDGASLASSLRTRVRGLDDSRKPETRPAPEARNSDSLDLMRRLRSLAQGYEAGAEIDWTALYPSGGRVVSLPRYPFQGERYWLQAKPDPEWKPKPEHAAESRFEDRSIYRVAWIERALDPSADATDIHWLVIEGASGFGAKLLDIIRRKASGVRFDTGAIRDGKLEQYLAAARVRRSSGGAAAAMRVVYVAGSQSAVELVEEALLLAQAVLKAHFPLKLWVVTERGQSLGQHDLPPREQHAALWGFIRNFALEEPQAAGGIIDVDLPTNQNVEPVYREIAGSGGEDRVAFHQGRRWLPRLQRRASEHNSGDSNSGPLSGPGRKLREDGWYLVTGAFGGIGMDLAEWLVGRGARHLLLLGRRAPETIGNAALLARLRALQARGITVQAEALDISDAASVNRLFCEIDRSGRPLYGLIHAAAAMPFAPVSTAALEDVLVSQQAKLEGAILLDRHTRRRSLDFFVLFSSGAAWIGARNTALYAAANSGLDALAVQRRAAELPALSIAWGLWEPTAANAQRDLIARSGFLPMPPAQALDALDRLLFTRDASAVIAAIDWNTLGPALEVQGKDSFVQDVYPEREEGKLLPAADTGSSRLGADRVAGDRIAQLQGLAAAARMERLKALISEQAKLVFGMRPDDPLDEERGLFQMGMNSLMSVQLKRRLEAEIGLKLPGTLTLTYPNVHAMASFLDTKLTGDGGAGADASAAANASVAVAPGAREEFSGMAGKRAGDVAAVAGMDESETDAAIAAELAALQQRLGAN